MIVRTFRPDDLARIDEQDATRWLEPYLSSDHAQSLAKFTSFTGEVDGCIVVCAGVADIWEGRGTAWAYLSRDAARSALAITRAVKRFLEITPMKRIEAAVDAEFGRANKWTKNLGFEIETPLAKSYFADGRNAVLYVKVK